MVRVRPALVLAGAEVSDTLLQVIERDREVPWVATRRLQPQSSGAEHTDPHEREHTEANERCCR
jgi:hypothetical protein